MSDNWFKTIAMALISLVFIAIVCERLYVWYTNRRRQRQIATKRIQRARARRIAAQPSTVTPLRPAAPASSSRTGSRRDQDDAFVYGFPFSEGSFAEDYRPHSSPCDDSDGSLASAGGQESSSATSAPQTSNDSGGPPPSSSSDGGGGGD